MQLSLSPPPTPPPGFWGTESCQAVFKNSVLFAFSKGAVPPRVKFAAASPLHTAEGRRLLNWEPAVSSRTGRHPRCGRRSSGAWISGASLPPTHTHTPLHRNYDPCRVWRDEGNLQVSQTALPFVEGLCPGKGWWPGGSDLFRIALPLTCLESKTICLKSGLMLEVWRLLLDSRVLGSEMVRLLRRKSC